MLQRFVSTFSGGYILAFHEIAPERAAALVDCLWPAQPVPLSELVQRSKDRRSTSGLLAITVDDGVGENVRALAALFQSRAWPATFFLPTQYLDTGDGMMFQWWRQLASILPQRKLVLRSGVLDLSTPGAIERLSRTMEDSWHSQRLETYLPMTMELAEVVMRERGLTREMLQPQSPITWREVEQMSKDDLIRFESHGVSHAAMSTLTESELEFEMRHSRDVISEHTGRPCRHLAYPFGSPRSIGASTALMAQRFYDSAVTMTLGEVSYANPWLLGRIPLYPSNSTLFAQLKVLLQYRPMRYAWQQKGAGTAP